MRAAQYVRQERAIHAATVNDIRQRWLWGLRLLRDGDAMSESKKSLRHGVTDQLVAMAKAAGIKLSAQEIQRRLRCARVYRTESQIRNACTDFENWHELVAANFPAYEAEQDEPEADHRTDDERKRDLARALADTMGDQAALFPLSDFEPSATTLKELVAYANEMSELTARFAKRDRERRDYLDRLIEVADCDLSMTWRDAHERLGEGPIEGEPPP